MDDAWRWRLRDAIDAIRRGCRKRGAGVAPETLSRLLNDGEV
jgi:hypothetical protein